MDEPSELDGLARKFESSLALISYSGTEVLFVAADAVALWRRPQEGEVSWRDRVCEQAALIKGERSVTRMLASGETQP